MRALLARFKWLFWLDAPRDRDGGEEPAQPAARAGEGGRDDRDHRSRHPRGAARARGAAGGRRRGAAGAARAGRADPPWHRHDPTVAPRRPAPGSRRRWRRRDPRGKTHGPLRFWDSSAIYPLLAGEASSARVRALLDDDQALIVWWGTELECVSAISRREREGTAGDVAGALARLEALAATWTEIAPATQLRRSAGRLLRVHPLRAADALQL